MPDVRLAATGMDSYPASDEDTGDELETVRNHGGTRFLLPSTSRQLVHHRYYTSHDRRVSVVHGLLFIFRVYKRIKISCREGRDSPNTHSL